MIPIIEVATNLNNPEITENDILNFLNKNKLLYDISVFDKVDRRFGIRINNGDWKHDHLALDSMIGVAFPSIKDYSEGDIEEDDGDTYTSTHYYTY